MTKHLLYREQPSEHGEHVSWRPPVDLYKSGNAIYVRVEVAGINESNFSVLMEDCRKLIISGSRHDPAMKNGFYQMEIPFGHFRVSIEPDFDCEIDPKKITSSYQNGFLCVKCPIVRKSEDLRE